MGVLGVNIELPKIFRPLLGRENSIGVETAHVNSRVDQALLAMAFQRSQLEKIAIVTNQLEICTMRLKEWHRASKRRFPHRITKFDRCKVVQVGDIFLIEGHPRKSELPFSKIDLLIYTHAHASADSRDEFYGFKQLIIAGWFTSRGHWFYDYCREPSTKLLRYNLQDIIEYFPDQEEVMARTHPMYERNMLLEDVETTVEIEPFHVFARKRLKVKTDKKAIYLDDAQIKEARSQLGPDWESGRVGVPIVSFRISPLQRRYLAQKRLAVSKGKKPWYVLLKYRRGGFTTIEQGQSYQILAETPNSQVATLAHTAQSTTRITQIIQTFYNQDQRAPERLDDTGTRIQLANGSNFFLGTAGGRGFSRGDTLQRVHGSEVSKWCEGPRQIELCEDLMAGLMGAASNGEIVLESTPNGREYFCQLYEDAKNGLNEFTPIFLRWFDDPTNVARPGTYIEEEIVDSITEEEKGLIEQHNLSISQIAFRRQSKKTYRRLFPQEFPEDDISCFLTSGICFFDIDLLFELIKKVPAVVEEKHYPGGYLKIWERPEPNVQYVIGCDTSEGLATGDRNGCGVLRKDNGAQVASLHGFFSIRAQAEYACMLSKMYNDALLGIERENHGHAVLEKVKELGLTRPHFMGGQLYFFSGRRARSGSLQDTLKHARAGWSTNSETRPVMLDELSEALEEGYLKPRCADFLSECMTFRLQPNGKYEADLGSHDDHVMKWAIAWQMRKQKKLKPSISSVPDPL